MKNRFITPALIVLTCIAILPIAALGGEREVFQTPGNGQNLGVWRITNEPEVRHWANYHNIRCWSADGRFLCYARDPENKRGAEVFLYDAHEDVRRRIDSGALPRWAHRHGWLFYRHLRRDEKDALISDIVWLDVSSGQRRVLASIPGEVELGEPDFEDQWLYGNLLLRGKDKAAGVQKERSSLRIRIAEKTEKAEVQPLPKVKGYQFVTNPQHPMFFTRWKGDKSDFSSSRLWYDLDGSQERIGIPMLQNAHTSWLGDGEYHLMGNGLVRGRRWSEPFPSNVHILAAVSVGDVSPCGASGRFATGDESIADLRSGDGWTFIHPFSHICFPSETGDASTIFDADPKGSPDGTKIALVTNYDLKDGPLTFVTQDLADDADELRVESTALFPESGALVTKDEIIGYQRKTPDRFIGLTRRLHDTLQRPVRAGGGITLFDARLLNEEQWQRIGAQPSEAMRNGVGAADPILLRQRQTQVHVIVVRAPQPPVLRLTNGAAQLIPAEEHRETFGYHLLRDGQRITQEPLRPGSRFDIATAGEYRAIATEWSGLESPPSPPLNLAASSLTVLADTPPDFTWTTDRWLIDGHETSADAAKNAAQATREIIHRIDGVIHRETHANGLLIQRQDLNLDGKPIRKLTYRDSRLTERTFTNREGIMVSRERFDAEGFITETILYDRRRTSTEPQEIDHWWFERGMPVKQLKEGREFTRIGDQWQSREGRKSKKVRGKTTN